MLFLVLENKLQSDSRRSLLSLDIFSKTDGFATILMILIIVVVGGGLFWYFTTQPSTESESDSQLTITTNVNQGDTPSSTSTKVTDTEAPTTAPTAAWKTYTNDTYGYSFRYPVEMESLSRGENDIFMGISGPLQGDSGLTDALMLSTIVMPNLSGQDLRTFTYEGLSTVYLLSGPSDLKDVQLDGVAALHVKQTGSDPFDIYAVSLSATQVLLINGGYASPDTTRYQEYETIYRQIIDSFKLN